MIVVTMIIFARMTSLFIVQSYVGLQPVVGACAGCHAHSSIMLLAGTSLGTMQRQQIQTMTPLLASAPALPPVYCWPHCPVVAAAFNLLLLTGDRPDSGRFEFNKQWSWPCSHQDFLHGSQSRPWHWFWCMLQAMIHPHCGICGAQLLSGTVHFSTIAVNQMHYEQANQFDLISAWLNDLQ